MNKSEITVEQLDNSVFPANLLCRVPQFNHLNFSKTRSLKSSAMHWCVLRTRCSGQDAADSGSWRRREHDAGRGEPPAAKPRRPVHRHHHRRTHGRHHPAVRRHGRHRHASAQAQVPQPPGASRGASRGVWAPFVFSSHGVEASAPFPVGFNANWISLNRSEYQTERHRGLQGR